MPYRIPSIGYSNFELLHVRRDGGPGDHRSTEARKLRGENHDVRRENRSQSERGIHRNRIKKDFAAYAGGKNAAHSTMLVAPHSTAQMIYARPHRGRSTTRAAAAQYVVGSAGNNLSAIWV